MAGNGMLTEKLRNCEKIFATSLVSIQWSGVIEIFENDVLDFLIIDLEHGSFSIEAVENLIRTARARRMPVIVRVAHALPSAVYLFGCRGLGGAGAQGGERRSGRGSLAERSLPTSRPQGIWWISACQPMVGNRRVQRSNRGPIADRIPAGNRKP